MAASGVDVYYAEDRKREITKKVASFGAAWAGAKGGAWTGARVGASIAGIGGQLGPQAAAPEELVTVPVAGMVGGTIGAIVGGIAGALAGETVTEYVWETLLFPLEKEEWIVCEGQVNSQAVAPPQMDKLSSRGTCLKHFAPPSPSAAPRRSAF